jgi:hypothetical protein
MSNGTSQPKTLRYILGEKINTLEKDDRVTLTVGAQKTSKSKGKVFKLLPSLMNRARIAQTTCLCP